MWLRNVFILELLLGARVEYSNKHVGDYAKDASMRYNATLSMKGIGVLFSPTNGRLHSKTSLKFGSQYGCDVQLNWVMFIVLFSYLSTAALLLYTSR